MTVTITGQYATDPAPTELSGLAVAFTPVSAPFFEFTGGTWVRVATGSALSALTDSAGNWTSPALPASGSSTSDPASALWQIREPDGMTWQGVLPSVSASYTLRTLIATYGWAVVAAPASVPTVTVLGPVGPTGPAGGTTNWRGAWSASTAYLPNDAVSDVGASYACSLAVGPTATHPGSDAAHWTLIASAGGVFPTSTVLSSYASFAAAITAIGSTVQSLVIDTNGTVAATVTVPSTLTLVFGAGKTLTVNTGQTLTVNGNIIASPIGQIFTLAGTGAVTLGPPAALCVYPEWFGAKGDGTTDDTTAIKATIAALSGGGLLRFLDRTYLWGTGIANGNVFQVSANGIELMGDGIGDTIIQGAASIVLTGDLITFDFTGRRQCIHDLSIIGGAGMSDGGGGFTSVGIKADQGSYDGLVYNVDISNMWGGNVSGASGVATYQPAGQADFTTTLGTAVASAGSHTVTPPSMTGIFPGRMLHIAGAVAEDVVVQTVTTTTWTGVFAQTHANTDVVTARSFGEQRWNFRDISVHDAYAATAYLVNSRGNTFTNCRATNVGSDHTHQHGWYIQAGGNAFLRCRAEGVAGYSFHQYVAAAGEPDNTGCRWINCESINPGGQHVLVNQGTADGTDPLVPSGQELQRNTVFDGCTFRCTIGAPALSTGLGIDTTGDGTLFTNCYFEDTNLGTGAWLQTKNGTNTQILGCTFRFLNQTNQLHPLDIGAGTIVKGCQFLGANCGGVKISGADCLIEGNYANVGASWLQIFTGANNLRVTTNRVVTGGDFANYFTGPPTNVVITGNLVTLTGTGRFITQAAGIVIATGEISGNRWSGGTGGLRYLDIPLGVDIHDNAGPITQNDQTAGVLPLETASGRMLRFPKGTNTLTGALAVRLDGNGNLINCRLTDTQFLGFAPCNHDATSGAALVCGGIPGTVIPGVLTDGPFVAGNVGILSATVAGQLTDTGVQTPPATSGTPFERIPPTSYVVFLTSGASAGAARVLVQRTV